MSKSWVETDHDSVAPWGTPGPLDDQRNPEGAAVEQDGVGELAMLAETFAVIRGEDDNGVGELAAGLEEVEQPADFGVGIGDLAVVEPVAKLHVVGRRGRLRLVRVEEVDKGEEGAAGPIPVVGDDGIHHRSGGSFVKENPLDLIGPLPIRVLEFVVEVIESLIETEPGRHREGADKGRCVISGGPKDLGESEFVLGNDEGAVVVHAVGRRVVAGHHGRVAGEGDGHRSEVVEKDKALGREPVDGGGARPGVTVGSEVIGSGRVHGNEEEIRPVVGAGAAGRETRQERRRQYAARHMAAPAPPAKNRDQESG